MKYTLNLGSRPFTHDMPCGYRPWADLATTLTGAAETGVDTTDCWTCQGRCTTYNVGAASCSAYEDGDRFKVYSDWGMIPGGSEQKVI